jgi:transketolase
VGLAVESAAAMSDKKVRVVSMPSTDAFDTQDKYYTLLKSHCFG